jgi:predicted esterase
MMKSLRKRLFFVFWCIVLPIHAWAAPCEDGDGYLMVRGESDCLVVKVHMHPQASLEKTRRLVFFMHGDLSRGGSAEGYNRFFDRLIPVLDDKDTLFLHIIRPGYSYLNRGTLLTSEGTFYNRTDNYTRSNLAEIKAVVTKLTQRFSPEEVVVSGHSGGAISAANLLGIYPGLARKAFLIACVCAYNDYSYSYLRIRRSENPSTTVKAIAANSVIVAYTGSDDTLTPVSLVEPYIRESKGRGLDAELVTAPGSHNDIFQAIPYFVDLIKKP